MNNSSTTISSTEADLEARIHGVMLHIFPWLNTKSITHQNQFNIKVGHGTVTINGKKINSKSARLDVLVSYEGKPLVVIELKREGLPLTKDDEKQGLSYARMIEVMPPLVIVSNGDDSRILQSYNGELVGSGSILKERFTEIINSVGKVAADDLNEAINTLLGTNKNFWIHAINSTTDATLRELTGGFSDQMLPFTEKYLIPRKATQETTSLLLDGERIVIVEGAPLSGKSCVLREIVEETRKSNKFVVLFIEADPTKQGLLQSIANTMSKSLSWSLSDHDIRNWLRNLVQVNDGPGLVIAVDGAHFEQEKIRIDIDELISNSFGTNLQIVLTLDDAVTEKWTRNRTGRKKTSIGRLSKRVLLSELSDIEFNSALSILHNHRISFMEGCFSSKEFRVPWVLRSVAADITKYKQYANKEVSAVIPSLLGLELFTFVHDYFLENERLASSFSTLAKCVLMDATESSRSVSLTLESMSTFIIQNDTLKGRMEYSEINELEDSGYLKRSYLGSNTREVVIIPRFPEMLAHSIVVELSVKLKNKVTKDPVSAAKWLVAKCSSLPMGEIIGAQTIISAYINSDSISLDFINTMLSMRPKKFAIKAGTKVAMLYPDIGIINLEFTSEGNIIASVKGHEPSLIEVDPDEKCEFHSVINLQSWLILSHLAGTKMLVYGGDGQLAGEFTPALLLEIACCPLILRCPSRDPLHVSIHIHNIPKHGEISCYKNGIVEPITLSLMRGLAGWDIDDATAWLNEAVQRNSLPLLTRIDIALREITNFSDKQKASWANRVLKEVVIPAMENLPSLH